jgi:diguanylate cyclase (GGDEF)-like protein
VALLDIDLFREINDKQGHLAGDTCLKRIADRLTGAVRRGGFVARLGGDEFAILLQGVDADQAPALIDLIRIQSAEEGDAAAGRPPLKLSAGWAAVQGPVNKAGIQEAMDQADLGLRMAKREGRNRTRPAAN